MPLSKFILISLSICLCLFTQPSLTQDDYDIPFPRSVIKYMATRQVRYHHYLWHQVRGNWLEFDEATKDAFRAIGWDPPNPSRDSDGQLSRDNYAGEEFLYMHRQMMSTANQIITDNRERYGKIKGWTTIPAPGDPTYPVPPAYESFESWKTDDVYERKIKKVEQELKDPARLRKMTLNELGIKIEGGIHNTMHNRWSAESPMGYRGGGSIDNGKLPDVNKKWDDPEYDWLVDTYSSHVNPIFWKIHGWIDERVEDWRRANGLSSVRWTGIWTGGPMSSLGEIIMKQKMTLRGQKGDPDAVGDLLEKAVEIFLKSKVPEINPANEVSQEDGV